MQHMPPSILRAENISREFNGFHAVKDLSLEIGRGSIHALIGPNGAGKTTVFNLLTKVLECSSGRIFYNERDITHRSPARVARLGMVRSFQISSVFPELTVLDNIRVALQRPQGLGGVWWRSRRALGQLDDRAMELLDSVQLASMAGRRASSLPYGRKRALELATTLALDPKLLLLDEPLAGMGHEDVGHVSALIQRVAEGRTVLMVEHNLKAVAALCDRITVLARGEKLAEGSYETVSRDPEVRAAYMGSAADV